MRTVVNPGSSALVWNYHIDAALDQWRRQEVLHKEGLETLGGDDMRRSRPTLSPSRVEYGSQDDKHQ